MSYALDAQRRVKMSSNDAEFDLISKAVAGDLAALELLLFRHRKRLTAYVQARFPPELRDSLEPQDIVQDTWLRAIRAIATFRPDGFDPFRRWLVTIARHVIDDQLKYIRSTKRQGVRVQTDQTDENASIIQLLGELALYKRTPSKSAANHELVAALESGIAKLPGDQAEALRLRFLNGVDIKEIAAKMNRSAGAISMLCNRAMKSLRWEMRSVSAYI